MALAEISDRLLDSSARTAAASLLADDRIVSIKLEDYRRRLYLFLRAMWGRDFLLQPHGENHVFIQQRCINLPAQLSAENVQSAEVLYQAMAAHAAAHLLYTEHAVSYEGLTEVQRYLIGLVDDARVEYKAIQHDRCLQKMWRQQILNIYPDTPRYPVVAILQQLILALLDASYKTSNAALNQWLNTFNEQLAQHGERPMFSVEMGLALYHVLSQEYASLNMSILRTLVVPYRDDNRLLWDWAPEARVETIPYQMQCLAQLGTQTLPKTIYAQLGRKLARQKVYGHAATSV